MRTLLLALLSVSCLGTLSAQRTDTVFFGNEEYKFMVRYSPQPSNWTGTLSYHDHSGTIRRKLAYRKGKLHGDLINYGDSGQVMSVQPFSNGKLDGEVRTYHRNGNIAWTKPYRKGKLHGERVLRDSTGAFFTGDDVQDLPGGHFQIASHCVNGRPEGKVVGTRDGKLSYIGNYKHGLADGAFIYYNQAGTPSWKDVYRDGRFIRSERVNE